MIKMSSELQLYKGLEGRRPFSKAELTAFQNEEKGHEGEQHFAELLHHHVDRRFLSMYNVLLEHRGTVIEIDCLLLFQNQLFLFEVKNYRGEFKWHADYLYAYHSKKQYRNPTHQLQRTEIILREILSTLDATYQIHSYVIFVHPTFTLYHAERDTPVILPTNIQAFLSRFQQIPDKLTPQHEHLLRQLETLRLPVSPYTKHPDVSYNQLKKDLFCQQCRRSMESDRRKISCATCAYSESTDSSLLRHIIEFELLFPDELITTGVISEWIGGKLSKTTLRRVMNHYMQAIPNGKYTHYIFSS